MPEPSEYPRAPDYEIIQLELLAEMIQRLENQRLNEENEDDGV